MSQTTLNVKANARYL